MRRWLWPAPETLPRARRLGPATTRARELCGRAIPLDARQPREPSKRRTTNAQAGAMQSEAPTPRRSERGTQATTEQMNLNSLPPNARNKRRRNGVRLIELLGGGAHT